MAKYEVCVGNIGRVYEGENPIEARRIYGKYRSQSESGLGRAGGEDVTLFKDGEPELEFSGQISRDEALADKLEAERGESEKQEPVGTTQVPARHHH
jgi:hypothetical protein